MSDRVLQVEVRRGVTTLTLDSPADRNALSRAMRAKMRSALTEAIADDSVRVVVPDHTGRVSCSGTDLAEAAGGAAENRGVDGFAALLTSSARFSANEEGQEGIAAFREERPARWVPA